MRFSSPAATMRTSRALEPVDGPTTPASSSRSISRPARAKPTRSLRCSIEVEPSWLDTTRRRASAIPSAASAVPAVAGRVASSGMSGAVPTLAVLSTGPVGSWASTSASSTSAAVRAWAVQNSTTWRTSCSSTHAPWMRWATLELGPSRSMSPHPTRRSAPCWSRMTRLSARLDTAKARRDGMLALMTTVMTLTDGRWVATTKWMPTALAIWARRQMESSTSRAATIMRSESSSTTTRMNGRRWYETGSPSSSAMPSGARRSPRSNAAL